MPGDVGASRRSGASAAGGMDPQAHRLDDELQTKARGATSFSSRTKAREVLTPVVPKWYDRRGEAKRRSSEAGGSE